MRDSMVKHSAKTEQYESELKNNVKIDFKNKHEEIEVNSIAQDPEANREGVDLRKKKDTEFKEGGVVNSMFI